MKTWLSWLALASLLWAIPPALLAQDSTTTDEQPATEEEVVEATPTALPTPVPTQGGERIEATVEQLEQLINAPEEARLGREVDESDQPFTLFGDRKRIEELLGDNPRYVYVPSGTDPMIVPWVRNRVMAAELLSEAREFFMAGRLQDALDKLNMILERFGDSDSVEKTRELKMTIEKRIAEGNATKPDPNLIPPGPTPRDLPVWISENTRGIVFDVDDAKKSSVLIGEYILHPGESIPSYPGIKVVAIDRSRVTLDYQGQVFQLQVEGN